MLAAGEMRIFRRKKFWPAARLSSHVNQDPIRVRSSSAARDLGGVSRAVRAHLNQPQKLSNNWGPPHPADLSICQSIDWFSEGEAKTVEVAGLQITVRFIGQKGRRSRISIEAPAGAVFRGVDRSKTTGSPSHST